MKSNSHAGLTVSVYNQELQYIPRVRRFRVKTDNRDEKMFLNVSKTVLLRFSPVSLFVYNGSSQFLSLKLKL